MSIKKNKTTRRDFLKEGTAVGVAFWVSGRSALAEETPKSEKLNIACIGVGGKGRQDSSDAARLGNVVAICDVDDEKLGKGAEKLPDAKKYHDFRKMLEEMDKQIDAVTISTPDHTHAIATMTAMQMGKHVYTQKPMTHSIQEARALRMAAQKYKVATQMGNQGTTADGLRRCVELVRAGAIGPVREAHVWTNRPTSWKQAPAVVARPTEQQIVPPDFHWDLFLGPAPERPYNFCYRNGKWRGWWDFGTGALGDMGCHTANMPFMALNLEYPTSVVAESGEVNPETYPGWATIHWQFPARGDMPPVKMTWYEGKKGDVQNFPAAELLKGEKMTTSGAILVGDKGSIFSGDDYCIRFKLLPEKDFEGFEGPPKTLPRNGGGDPGHKREWLDAAKGGPPAMSNFGYAGLLTETILLGNLAIRVGKKIEWDGPKMLAKNAPEAEPYISPAYHNGYKLTS